MDNNKTQAGASSSSSSTMNFDHLFGLKEYSSTSSSSTGLFGSIFPPPSSVEGKGSKKQEVGSKNSGSPGSSHQSKKGESSNSSRICNKNISSNYQNETVEPSYFSSSIYYGGQENYSPRSSRTTTQPHHVFKKDKDDGDNPNGNDSNSASRGNWWQGSLYY